MGNLPVDVLLVGANQAGEGDILVVDAKLVAFAKERFRQDDNRALAQIVGARLEAESEEADPLLAAVDDLFERMLDLKLVAAEDLLNHRHLEVHFLRTILKRADIFRQA